MALIRVIYTVTKRFPADEQFWIELAIETGGRICAL